MLLEGIVQKIQNIETQVCEIAQAMTKRVDNVEHQLESIRSYQKIEAEMAVQHRIFELKTQILHEVAKRLTR